MDIRDLCTKLTEQMPIGAMIWRVVSGRLEFVHANPQAGRLLGRSLDARVALRLLGQLNDEGGHSLHAMLVQTARRGSPPPPCECAWSRPGSGLEIWLRFTFIALGEGLVGLLVEEISLERGVRKMLTEQTQELARSNAELEEFAYVASHELQQPLITISNQIQLLELEVGDSLGERAHGLIRQSLGGVWRMKDLINALLEFSRLGTQARTMEVVNGELLIDQALADLHATIAESGAKIEVAPMPRLTGDRSQLKRLFVNLIGNAIKFRGDAPPRVSIGMQRQPEGWLFSVKDNGIGIKPEDHEKIFGLFQRVHARERFAGTGLGLALCRKIVETHGGRLWVESQEGQGAKFLFTLPFQVMSGRS